MKQGVIFENKVLQLIQSMGFIAQTTKSTGDGGIDIIAHSNQPLMKGKYIIQCKDWDSPVGEPPLRDLYGVVHAERANKGILITSSTFTSHAIRFAENKPLELIDGKELSELLLQYGLTSQGDNADDNEMESYGPNIMQEAFEKGLLQLTYVDTNDPDCELEDCLYEFGSVSIGKDFTFMGQTKGFTYNDIYVIEKGQGNFEDDEDEWIKYISVDAEVHFHSLSTLQIKFQHTVLKTCWYELHFKGINEFIGDLWNEIPLGNNRNNTNKQCFIATEVYGDNNCISVQVLRWWRDNFLTKSKSGRGFVAYYYRNGEKFALFIRQHPLLKGLIKCGLNKIVGVLSKMKECKLKDEELSIH